MAAAWYKLSIFTRFCDSITGREERALSNAFKSSFILIPNDLVIITADHGCDPTFAGNGHTRENVPVIIYSRNFKSPRRLQPFETLANIGATIADNFDIEFPEIGESILEELE